MKALLLLVTIVEGVNMTEFRGFLIQAVMMSDGTSGVGTFVGLSAVIPNTNGVVYAKNGLCTPTNSSATHVQPSLAANRVDIPYVRLYWRAPAASTGPIRFR